MSELRELFNEMKDQTISLTEFKEAFVSIGTEEVTKFHIYHHYDADGFASAAVLLKYYLCDVDRKNISTYVCEHSSQMDLTHIKKDDIVFIVDYSFPECDREPLKNLYNNVTKNIIWVDHHKTSDLIFSSGDEFLAMATNGLVETSNRFAGCLLTFLWGYLKKIEWVAPGKYVISKNLTSSISESNINNLLCKDNDEDVYSLAPYWVRLVSDYDTFRHKYSESIPFEKGLIFEGLNNLFINPENKESFLTQMGPKQEYDFINDITKTGRILVESDKRRNKKLVKINSFEVIFKYHIQVDGSLHTNEYKVICMNGYGNSLVFGELYDQYDAVCIFNYAGKNYKYSMFARKDSSMDCSLTALYYNEVYGLNGGGHKHACGWSAPCNIFESEHELNIYVK